MGDFDEPVVKVDEVGVHVVTISSCFSTSALKFYSSRFTEFESVFGCHCWGVAGLHQDCEMQND